jgi:hypothetical protein
VRLGRRRVFSAGGQLGQERGVGGVRGELLGAQTIHQQQADPAGRLDAQRLASPGTPSAANSDLVTSAQERDP